MASLKGGFALGGGGGIGSDGILPFFWRLSPVVPQWDGVFMAENGVLSANSAMKVAIRYPFPVTS